MAEVSPLVAPMQSVRKGGIAHMQSANGIPTLRVQHTAKLRLYLNLNPLFPSRPFAFGFMSGFHHCLLLDISGCYTRAYRERDSPCHRRATTGPDKG